LLPAAQRSAFPSFSRNRCAFTSVLHSCCSPLASPSDRLPHPRPMPAFKQRMRPNGTQWNKQWRHVPSFFTFEQWCSCVVTVCDTFAEEIRAPKQHFAVPAFGTLLEPSQSSNAYHHRLRPTNDVASHCLCSTLAAVPCGATPHRTNAIKYSLSPTAHRPGRPC
jgi:hypothetical protein